MRELERPVISVCIANYNGENLLADCIESVIGQQGDFEVEIIVHDDASRDGSLQLLARYPQVLVIESADNVGFCIANNRMAQAAKGSYLLLLNNDAALMPGALAALLDHAREPGPARVLSLPQYDWETGELVDYGCLLDPLHVPMPNLCRQHEKVAYVIGACLWMEREDWLRLGGLPEWMGSIGEDLFLCAHARLQGMHVEVAQGSGYRHRQGASFGGNRADAAGLRTNYRRRYLSERNRAAVLVTCTPGFAWLPWALVHAVVLVAEGVALSLLKRSTKLWREVYGATLVWMWQQRTLLKTVRKNVQGGRQIGFRTYVQDAYTWKLRKLGMLLRHGMPELK